MKKIITFLILSFTFISFAHAQTDPYKAKEFYENGVSNYNNKQYQNAVSDFKKSLRILPDEQTFRDALVSAYQARAENFSKQKNPVAAANDLRSALFYLEHWGIPSNKAQVIAGNEAALNSILKEQKADLTPNGRYKTATALRSKGEFAAAGYEFFKIINDKNFKNAALENLGDIYKNLGYIENALDMYEKGVQNSPKNANLHFKFAMLLEQSNHQDYAMSEYNKALEVGGSNEQILTSLERMWKNKIAQNPNDSRLYNNLGAILQKKGDIQGAKTQYLKAKNLDANDAITKLNLASLYVAEKNPQMAIQSYDEVLAVDPRNIQAHFYKAESLKELKDYNGAIAQYRALLAIDPSNQVAKEEIADISKNFLTGDDLISFLSSETAKNPSDFQLQYDLAYELHKQKKYDEALSAYNRALSLKPDQPEIYINMAQIYKAQNDSQKAISVLNTGLYHLPKDAKITQYKEDIVKEQAGNLYQTATDFFNKGDYRNALINYQKIPIQTEEVLFNIGASYYGLNDKQNAIDAFKKVLVKNPKNTDAIFYVASCYLDLHDKKSAKEYFQNLLAVNPNHQASKDALASLNEDEISSMLDEASNAIDAKDFTRANGLLDRVISLSPKNAYAFYYKGMIFDESKQYETALKQYSKALAIDPNFALCYYAMGLDYDYLEKYIQAKTSYEKFLTLMGTTEDDYTKYVKTRLEELR